MSITVTELALESRTGDVSVDGRSSTAELVYIVNGTALSNIAVDSVRATAPTVFNGLIRRRFAFEPMSNAAYKVTVSYDSAKRLQVNEFEYEFDIGVQDQRITQSKKTEAIYRAPRAGSPTTAPNYRGAINVQDGRVQGVDVSIPTYQWTETYIFPAEVVTESYKNTLYNLTATKNNAFFRGKAAGEVLFGGCRGRLRNEDEFSISFQFIASPNVANLNINGMSITKKGHDFIWFVYADVQDTGGNVTNIVKNPVFAYIEKVYEDGDFSLLGIGT